MKMLQYKNQGYGAMGLNWAVILVFQVKEIQQQINIRLFVIVIDHKVMSKQLILFIFKSGSIVPDDERSGQ